MFDQCVIICCLSPVIKANHCDFTDDVRMLQKLYNFFCGNRGSVVQGKPVNAGAYGWERNGTAPIFLSQIQTIAVAISKQLWLIVISAAPDGAGSMNDIPCRQSVPCRNFSMSRFTAIECFTLHQQLRACCPMDSSINTTTAQKRGVGSVYNSVYQAGCNVPFYNLKTQVITSFDYFDSANARCN